MKSRGSRNVNNVIMYNAFIDSNINGGNGEVGLEGQKGRWRRGVGEGGEGEEEERRQGGKMYVDTGREGEGLSLYCCLF